jgi:hypothetical protein
MFTHIEARAAAAAANASSVKFPTNAVLTKHARRKMSFEDSLAQSQYKIVILTYQEA